MESHWGCYPIITTVRVVALFLQVQGHSGISPAGQVLVRPTFRRVMHIVASWQSYIVHVRYSVTHKPINTFWVSQIPAISCLCELRCGNCCIKSFLTQPPRASLKSSSKSTFCIDTAIAIQFEVEVPRALSAATIATSGGTCTNSFLHWNSVLAICLITIQYFSLT